MATYKAEFLSHYYEGRMRPRHAYSMGWINRWAELASLAPDLANFFSQTPGLSAVAKWLGGIDQRRRMPAFARQTFKDWFRRRTPPNNPNAAPVILWPDTFNNYLTPETAKAAVEVLEAAGRRVLVPEANFCCGRPLYDFGMLDLAKAYLRDILTKLQSQIQAGIPVVGLEPSCVAVFRDELTDLFPNDKDAQRLSQQTFLLSEFLNRELKDYRPPRLERKALVHFHCHHKSVLGKEDEEELLKKIGIDYSAPEDGCCGMAGSFGFEAGGGHYDVSVACGERVLLPAVRKEDRHALDHRRRLQLQAADRADDESPGDARRGSDPDGAARGAVGSEARPAGGVDGPRRDRAAGGHGGGGPHGRGRGRRPDRLGPDPEGDAMKSKLLDDHNVKTFALVFDTGDEVAAGLLAFAQRTTSARPTSRPSAPLAT